MSNALVVRTQRHKKIGDAASPMVFTLKRMAKDAKIFNLARIAQDIEALGGMSAEDVEHVGKAIVRQMRQTLTDGNSVRLDGFGIFHTTFKCRATEVAKDCTVKNIERSISASRWQIPCDWQTTALPPPREDRTTSSSNW